MSVTSDPELPETEQADNFGWIRMTRHVLLGLVEQANVAQEYDVTIHWGKRDLNGFYDPVIEHHERPG